MVEQRDQDRIGNSTINDTEAQFKGDVEGSWVEVRDQATAPATPTDKQSGLLYTLASDRRLRFKNSAGLVFDLTLAGSAPITLRGTIAVAADFPTAAAVEDGWAYLVTAAVTDNDATKTNTGQAFPENTEIVWNGTNWTVWGQEATVEVITASPHTVPDGNADQLVDTATLAVASQLNLPAAVAGMVGAKVRVSDLGLQAGTYLVAIQPDLTDTINGVNGPWNIDHDGDTVELECVAVGAWQTMAGEVHRANRALAHGWIASELVDIDPTSVAANAIPLPGRAGRYFVPISLILYVSADGGLNGDASLSIGTTPGGAEIMAPAPIAMATVNTSHVIGLTGVLPAMAADGNLDISITAGDSGVSGTVQAQFIGREI